ncbi:hypothetical protein AB2B41_22885, partial [Marimonas sp. MJW-29]
EEPGRNRSAINSNEIPGRLFQQHPDKPVVRNISGRLFVRKKPKEKAVLDELWMAGSDVLHAACVTPRYFA